MSVCACTDLPAATAKMQTIVNRVCSLFFVLRRGLFVSRPASLTSSFFVVYIFFLSIFSDPCGNQGMCVDHSYGFLCECPAGFTGPQCMTNVDECADSPCENGATCVDAANNYECVCKRGFSGRNCHINDDDCQSGYSISLLFCFEGIVWDLIQYLYVFVRFTHVSRVFEGGGVS